MREEGCQQEMRVRERNDIYNSEQHKKREIQMEAYQGLPWEEDHDEPRKEIASFEMNTQTNPHHGQLVTIKG